MALDHFAQLASVHELPDFPIDIFVSAARRVIHAASDVLYSILETDGSLTRLEVLHTLMRSVIEISFLVLPLSSESFGDLLFNQLSGLLLSPVIHSFFPLSIKSLGYLLASNSTPSGSEPQGAHQNGPDLHIDRRPKLLEFFQGIISGLFSAPCSLAKTASGNHFYQNSSSMREILVLETIRHLKGILSPIPIDNHILDATSGKGKKYANPLAEDKVDSRSAIFEKDLRVRRLAVKDAMWYLCSVFHILIGSKAPYILSSTANSDSKLVDDLDYMQHAGSETLEKSISQELFELLIDTRLRYHEYSLLPSGSSQRPVGSFSGAIITGMTVKTALFPSEEASSH